MKISISPSVAAFYEKAGGVYRVVEALTQLLPQYGVEVVPEHLADVVHAHAVTRWDENKPSVYTNHGVFAEPVESEWQRQAREAMLHSIFVADVVTSVSRWGTGEYRHLGRDVRIITNGVDCKALQPVGHQQRGYVLWSKINLAGPCLTGCKIALKLAAEMPDVQFVFTLLPPGMNVPGNVKVIGPQDYASMMRWLAGADCYLSTTLENFSVQVIEALALGVPVVATHGGGNDETEGVVAVDVNELSDTLRKVLGNRKQYSEFARTAAQQHYDWSIIVPKYVSCYEQAIAARAKPKLDASIVITCYNLDEYIAEAIESAIGQKHSSFEVIVVDDGSKDDSWEIIQSFGDKVRSFRQKNQGVAKARNAGVEKARGEFVVCLDGDDRLHEEYLGIMTRAMRESDKTVGMVYCQFAPFITGDKPSTPIIGTGWDLERLKQFNFIGNATLFRKEAWRRAHGYRSINPSWEDYNLWLTIAEAGYQGLFVPACLWDYRVKSQNGRNFESQTQTARLRATVNAYHPRWFSPAVSVVIPCYKHEKYLPEAVQSVLEQTYQDFEIIVVDDGSPGDVVKALKPFVDEPRVRLIRQANKGLAAARNVGVRNARGKYILPLDADDKIAPRFLELTVAELAKGDGIAYTDFVAFDDKGMKSEHVLPEYDFKRMVTEKGMMFCSSLYSRTMWAELGGYNETFRRGWEDYAFWIAAGIKGYYGRKVPGFLFWYRQHKNSMRLDAEEHKEEIMRQLVGQFGDLYKEFERGQQQMGSKFGGFEDIKQAAGPAAVPGSGVGQVRLEYIGPKLGGMTMIGPVTKRQYMFGASPVQKRQWVDARDAKRLMELTTDLRMVTETGAPVGPISVTPPPTVAEVVARTEPSASASAVSAAEFIVETPVPVVSEPLVELAAPNKRRGRKPRQ